MRTTLLIAAVAAVVLAGAPPTASAQSNGSGMNKETATGFIDYVSQGPMSVIVTPSGIMHMDVDVYDYFYGDIEGPATFFEQFHVVGHGSHGTGSGPFEATVTWNGRTGMISGQWTTNCSMVTGCDGTMNARGSGELEDVQFHFKWGPGDYPLPYIATVLYK